MAGLLDGVRVLDFTQVIAGPACTRLMAELGAEVNKVELAPLGDYARGMPLMRDGRSAYFFQHNQGKLSLCLDLGRPRARAMVGELVKKADVMVENFSPGVIGRLGFGWDQVHALNPNLIMCSISAFGQTGPLAPLPGFDFIAQAYAGITSMIGDPDGPPSLTGFAVGDVGTGITALAAINAALFARSRGQGGRHLDISILDFYFHAHEISVEMASLGAWEPHRTGQHHGTVTPLGIFATRDGYLYIVVLQQMWSRFCAAMGRPDLEHDPRFAGAPERVTNRDALNALVQDWLMTLPGRDAALALLQKARVPVAPILSVKEAMAHPHMVGRGTVRDVCDPALGSFQVTGNPIRDLGGGTMMPGRAPFLGEHNRHVLARHAGVNAADLDALELDGTLVSEPVITSAA